MSEFIIFATADWHEPYWTNKQHTAKSFCELGHKVLYIESVGLRSPKLSSKKDVLRILNRLKTGIKTILFGAVQEHKNLWVLSPLLIPAAHRYPVIKKINTLMLEWLIKRHCNNNLFFEPLIWTYHPFMLDVIAKLNYHKIIYHCVDDLSSVPGIDKNYYIQEENKLLHLSDKVYVTTESLRDRCLKQQKNTEYFPNVVDFEHFSQALKLQPIPKDIEDIPEPRIIYHGVLSDFKLDFELLLDIAETNKNLNLVLLGDEREGQQNETFERIKKLSNVYALGYKKYKLLPQYLSHMNVAIIPTQINDYTNFMFPMKYYEYLAAGIPVVSTALKFTESVSNGLFVARDVNEFSLYLNEAIRVGKFSYSEAKSFVGENTWTARTKLMLERIDKGVSN